MHNDTKHWLLIVAFVLFLFLVGVVTVRQSYLRMYASFQWTGAVGVSESEQSMLGESSCDNGNDDDWDGATDCADSDCVGDPACGTTPGPSSVPPVTTPSSPSSTPPSSVPPVTPPTTPPLDVAEEPEGVQITLPTESYWEGLLEKLKSVDGRPGMPRDGEILNMDEYYSAAPKEQTLTGLAGQALAIFVTPVATAFGVMSSFLNLVATWIFWR